MTVNLINETIKEIRSLEKTVLNGKINLKWDVGTAGVSNFIVLFGETSDTVDLCNDKVKEDFLRIFPTVINRLKETGNAPLREMNIHAYLVSYADILRDGGTPIKEKPGVFAVYAIDENDTAVTVYTCRPGVKNHMYTFKLNVLVEQKPLYIKKGLVFKKEVYSGYYAITLQKGYANLSKDTLKYQIDDYSFPFPESIVKNGGTFYIKTQKSSNITFVSGSTGIEIK